MWASDLIPESRMSAALSINSRLFSTHVQPKGMMLYVAAMMIVLRLQKLSLTVKKINLFWCQLYRCQIYRHDFKKNHILSQIFFWSCLLGPQSQMAIAKLLICNICLFSSFPSRDGQYFIFVKLVIFAIYKILVCFPVFYVEVGYIIYL